MGYLIGSLPMGVIVARLTGGTDPRTVGSGRTGGTNTLRAGGWGRAIAVASLDLAKGAVPILIARAADAPVEVQALTGLAAVLGSWKSIFLGFHGGRGVATGVGGMIAIAPWIVPLALPAFAIIIWTTRYVSLGSILGTAFGAGVVIVAIIAGWLDAAWLLYVIPGEIIIWVAHATPRPWFPSVAVTKVNSPIFFLYSGDFKSSNDNSLISISNLRLR